jgi:hypothetical protein
MDIEKAKRRFVEEIKLRAYDDRFIDRQEEKEILKAAIEQGISFDSARAALVQVCDQADYTLETVLDQKAKEMLNQFASNDGHIDQKEFNDAVSVLHKAAKGRLNESRCRKKAKEIIQVNGWKAREGFLKGGSWFSDL